MNARIIDESIVCGSAERETMSVVRMLRACAHVHLVTVDLRGREGEEEGKKRERKGKRKRRRAQQTRQDERADSIGILFSVSNKTQ